MDFKEIIFALYGDEGKKWLDSLPNLLANYAQRWDLSLGAPFTNLSYNYVVPALRVDGTPAVLKAGFPNPELSAEIAALRHFCGSGIVKLLEADDEKGIFLLERIFPGETLWNMDDDEEATSIFLELMPTLWKEYSGDFPFKTTEDLGKGFCRFRKIHGGKTGRLDAKSFERAEKLFAALLRSSDKPVLLHGDLHHDNVLAARRAPYLAIDPKGVLGEPCYEVGAFLRNPMPDFLRKENPHKRMARRVDMIVERLGFDRKRVLGWAFSQAVLSAVWCAEDGVDCAEGAMVLAKIFERL